MIPKTHNSIPFKDLKRCYLDFEYNGSSEARFNVVCCSLLVQGQIEPTNFWTYKDPNALADLKRSLIELRNDHIFVAHNVVAEASAFISLGIDPVKCAWIDTQIEYKMLTNHWDKYRYGDQLIDGKKVKTTPPRSKWEQTEEEKKKENNAKPQHSLLSTTYKLLGKIRSSAHKDEMRDLIISAPESFTPEERDAIIKYCDEDVLDLPEILGQILNAYRTSTAKKYIGVSELAWRGQTAARTALITKTGYPVNRSQVTKFSRSVNSIMNELAEDINGQFPDMGLFVWNKKEGRYSKKEKPQKDWIAASEHADKWMRTDTGGYSLSLDAYSRHYSYSHDYPEGILPAQMLRYLKTKQSLNGFIVSKSKKNFFNYYGSDGRARAWLNPYGSQSSRYQPGASGYIPLKAAWMRSLIQPPVGNAICGIDYGSEEFLLSALLSKDKNMYQAYVSGDPYFHFAKLAEAVPMDAERKDHEKVRTLFKSTVLGISYLMGPDNLAIKLTQDTGDHYSPEGAKKLIQTFFDVFKDYANWIERALYEYQRRGFLKLRDGWIMFGDNRNHRSVSNCPIQGMGGAILRKAIQISQDRGLHVILPLHDALYIEFDQKDFTPIDTLYDSMLEAFCHYFQDEPEIFEWAKSIRMDIDVWGPGLKDREFYSFKGRPLKMQEIYIDPRSKREYEKFKKYLT